ncbi:MAG: hypothetical protein MUE66_03735 [Acidimicrobiia bacterium]|nr:hypothetical protein [Acidimicrobiia bacterium]
MTSRRLWVPLLVAMLAAALVGPGMVAGAEPRTTVTVTVVVPAAAFTPASDDLEYRKTAGHLALNTQSFWYEPNFYAPVYFEASTVTIKKVTFYATDDCGDSWCELEFSLWRVNPTTNVAEEMGSMRTRGRTRDIREFVLSDLSPRKITGAWGAVLGLQLYSILDGASFKGAKVTYSYETEG